jgi:hypothetical protein
METKVFISKSNEGWSEIAIPKEFQHYSYEKMVKKVYKILGVNAYKGLLITENPSPIFEGKQ